jgi:hypothetical protein
MVYSLSCEITFVVMLRVLETLITWLINNDRKKGNKLYLCYRSKNNKGVVLWCAIYFHHIRKYLVINAEHVVHSLPEKRRKKVFSLSLSFTPPFFPSFIYTLRDSWVSVWQWWLIFDEFIKALNKWFSACFFWSEVP